MLLFIDNGENRFSCKAKHGSTVLETLQEQGILLNAPCGGQGTCGKCRVLVHDDKQTQYRLACKTKVTDNMVVMLERMHDIKISKEGTNSFWRADGVNKLGIAIDIGTTTIVCRLVNGSTGEICAAYGLPNPQIIYGADVISRIAACTKGHLSALKSLLDNALEDLVEKVCFYAQVSPEHITFIVFAGNTTMEHLAAGIDPTPLGIMPFTPPSLFGCEMEVSQKLKKVYFMPCIAGYVGGDVLADLLALRMNACTEPIILLDLGTNGEIALGSKKGILTCATAAGPVFEGANITFGMPAYPGAIAHISFHDGFFECATIANEKPLGLCGTGLIDAMALMITTGVLDGSGLLLEKDDVPDHMARFIGEKDNERVFFITDDIYVTQKDIRQIQLAKAAICAGIYTMLDEAHIALECVDKLYIAGGFSEYLTIENACKIGLFPPELCARAEGVGNTAIEGLTAVLISSEARKEIQEIRNMCTYVELSLHKKFNEYYLESMELFEE